MSSKVTRIDIRAHDRIFSPRGAAALNIGMSQCLAELVANSLDWSMLNEAEASTISDDKKWNEKIERAYGPITNLITKKPNAEVEIHYDGKEFRIIDSGIGMTISELTTGLIFRGADDSTRQNIRSRKGTFGMGMKYGTLGMGWHLKIHTRPFVESNTEHVVEINTREIEAGRLSLDQIDVETDTHNEEGPLGSRKSGTAIIISDLHKESYETGGALVRLGSAFAPLLENGDAKITLYDSSSGGKVVPGECTPQLPIMDSGVEVIKLEKKDLWATEDFIGQRGKKLQIKGWIGLMETGSTGGKGEWGLHTYRKNQLIEAFHHDGPGANGLLPTNPHSQISRIFGVIHLDMCHANSTKMGWNRELKSWSEVQKLLKPTLQQLIDVARVPKTKVAVSRELKAWHKFVLTQSNMIEKIKKAKPSKRPGNPPKGIEASSKETIIIDNEHEIRIPKAIDYSDRSDSEAPWDYYFDDGELLIYINKSSNVWKKFTDSDTEHLANFAIADCVYQCLIDEFQYSHVQAKRKRDEWLEAQYGA